jgi:hypothetical protein
MSPHLHYEIARIRQHEMEARVMRARHSHDLPTSSRQSRRSIKVRIGRAVAVAGAVIGTVFATGDASVNASR